jgi:thiosulfate dehydrogenase [quinone] large subunit
MDQDRVDDLCRGSVRRPGAHRDPPAEQHPLRPGTRGTRRYRILRTLHQDEQSVVYAAILPLRLFLGGTFVYAALDKLTDPAFFDPRAPTYIGQQMAGYVRTGSPLSWLLTNLAIPHATVFGALIALGELWIGLATLAGLLTRVAALGGLALSLTFYLTSSWAISPYFMGPDLPYALGWLTLLLAGPTALSLDGYFFGAVRRAHTGRPEPDMRVRRAGLPDQRLLARRSFMRGIGAVVTLLVSGGLIGGIARLLTPTRVDGGSTAPLTAGVAASAGGGSKGTPGGSVLLGSVKTLPANRARPFTDPRTGDPAMLIHLGDGRFVAYSAVCTHAGCTVAYDSARAQLVCPCHGSIYDPRHGAQVVAGPAPRPLPAVPVRVDAQGNAYALGTAPADKPIHK